LKTKLWPYSAASVWHFLLFVSTIIEQFAADAELLQEALAQDNSAANGLTSAGLAALFAESWFPGLTPGYGAAGQSQTDLSCCLAAVRAMICSERVACTWLTIVLALGRRLKGLPLWSLNSVNFSFLFLQFFCSIIVFAWKIGHTLCSVAQAMIVVLMTDRLFTFCPLAWVQACQFWLYWSIAEACWFACYCLMQTVVKSDHEELADLKALMGPRRFSIWAFPVEWVRLRHEFLGQTCWNTVYTAMYKLRQVCSFNVILMIIDHQVNTKMHTQVSWCFDCRAKLETWGCGRTTADGREYGSYCW